MVAATQELLDVHCDFAGVSFGRNTVRLGVQIDRKLLNVKEADKLLCGRQIKCTVKIQPGGDDPNQTYFDGIGGGAELTGIANVHRFGVSPDQITAGLTFNKRQVDGDILKDFASQKGRLLIAEATDIPDEVKEPKKATAAPAGSLKTNEPDWRKAKLDDLFVGGLRQKFRDADLNTVGELVDFQKDGDQWMTKIKGIGTAAVDRISDVMERFWADNPQHQQSESLPIENPNGETAPVAETNGHANGKTARRKARQAAKAETNGDGEDSDVLQMMGTEVKVEKKTRGRPKNPK